MTEQELRLLTWRFATMIGIIAPHDDYSTPEEVASDRARWPHLIEIEDGLPNFNFDRCAEWMVELSGEPMAVCRKVLFAEWGDEEDQKYA